MKKIIPVKILNTNDFNNFEDHFKKDIYAKVSYIKINKTLTIHVLLFKLTLSNSYYTFLIVQNNSVFPS